jgi:hypothetical protein
MTRLTLLLFVLSLISVPAYAQSGDVVISEVMPDPSTALNEDGEYIELYNTTSGSITLKDWVLDVDGETDALSDVTVPADDFVVLCVNDDPSVNGGIDNCAADYVNEISLNNSGSSIVLNDANGEEVDRVEYAESDWPVANGASMEFIGAPGDNNNTPTNWQEAETRKGDYAGENGDLGSPNANASGGALPVELVAFNVAVDATSVVLTWTTASETNNAHFAVQHQGPQRSGYRTLGTRDGAGTTVQRQSYRFRVQKLRAGTHTFRLKQVDQDGTTHFTTPRTAKILPEARLTLVGANPLRTGDRLTVVATGAANGEMRVGLYNVLGQRLRTLASTGQDDEVVRVQLSAENLPSGMYFVSTEGEASRGATARFTVVR